MTESFRDLPLVARVCVAVGVAFALTQVEAAYERHQDYAPVGVAEDRASGAGQAVATLPFGVAEGWLRSRVVESEVRERWEPGNAAFTAAYDAVAGRSTETAALRGDRCYVFPVTGEVRTRLRGTVALAAYCFDGERPATAPVAAGLASITDG